MGSKYVDLNNKITEEVLWRESFIPPSLRPDLNIYVNPNGHDLKGGAHEEDIVDRRS